MHLKNKYFDKIFNPIIVSICSLLIGLLLANYFLNLEYEIEENEAHQLVYNILNQKKSVIEKAVFSRLYLSKSTASLIKSNPNISKSEFEYYAKEVMDNDSLISSMSAAKNGIINLIYPYKGHESVIGLNLLEHPERKAIVNKTIETEKSFLAGPVKLVEGGVGLISYTSIQIPNAKGQNEFWGVSDVVIKWEKVLDEINFASNQDLVFSIQGLNGDAEKGQFFYSDSSIFQKDPLKIRINLPIGSWILYAAPQKDWDSYIGFSQYKKYAFYAICFIISGLIWLWTSAAWKIKNDENILRAIFRSMQEIVLEFDENGTYINIAPTSQELLYLPANQLIGKKLDEIFPKETAEYFSSSIKKSIKENISINLEYPLRIGNENKWFLARISPTNMNTAVFVAHDISTRKQHEEKLLESESILKEMNITKDKFFSILAHDLKNPLGNLKHISDVLLDNYKDLEDQDKKEYVLMMQKSSNQVYNLLENLLDWSRSQRGLIQFSPSDNDIYILVDILIKILEPNAETKSIKLVNEIKSPTFAFIDANMINTVIRNLVTNAIKFSETGKTIRIVSQNVNISNKRFLEISVIDEGIGLSKDEISQLFRLDVSVSKIGTSNEKGTGLGLILCKEFVEKHGGKIKVVSEPNKGSIFSFTVPRDVF